MIYLKITCLTQIKCSLVHLYVGYLPFGVRLADTNYLPLGNKQIIIYLLNPNTTLK